MSPGSEPCAASTVAGGPASSSAGRAPASNLNINPAKLVINPSTPSRSPPFSAVMGQSFGKSQTSSLSPTGPPPSPSTTQRSFSAAMAGGLRLTRAWAGRRKKSEDITKMMDRSASQSDVSSASHTQRIEATASISSSPAQLATQVLKKAAKTPQRQQHSIPPPPPPKPQHASPETQSETPLRPPPQPKPSVDYRSSIIPISPGISSAVNYIRMEDQRASLEQDHVVDASTPSPMARAKGKQREDIYKAERHTEKRKDAVVVEQGPDADKGNALDKGEMKDSWRKSDSTMSHHTIRPGGQPSRPVSMAESLQSNHTIVPVKRQSALITDADFGMAEEEDDPESSVEDNSNEPVSQNSNIDQTPSPTPSAKARERRAMSLSLNHPAIAMMHKLPPTPSSASAANLTFSDPPPHSTPSYSRGTSSMRTAASAQGYIAPSSSRGGPTGNNIRTQLAVYSTQPQGQPHLQVSTGPSNPHARSTSPIPIHHPRAGTHNPYTTFAPPPEPEQQSSRPASRLDRSLPALPPHAQPQQPRQPTLSMSGGFGLAKRAVEKMGFGRALGLGSSVSSSHHGHSQTSGYSSSSSGHTYSNSNTPPSSYGTQAHDGSSKLAHSYGSELAAPRASTSSNSGQSSHGSGSGGGGGYLHKKNRSKHTPGAPSVSSITSHSTSVSDSDAMDVPSGPNFGKRLRGSLRRGGGGGIVFGRDLRSVVRETAVGVGKPKGWGAKWRNWESTSSLSGDEEKSEEDREKRHQEGRRTRKMSVKRGQLMALEDRKLPALVVRCAQHLLSWGIQEEGLFRIPGRALHVTRLRAEFDTGADFDMTDCSPGDLDPHAVASVFKAFLRELPEPILTSSLSPYFEAAMAQESSTNASKDTEAGTKPQLSHSGNRRPGLPSGPRNTGDLPSMRKAPSLTTLAMPNMAGFRPPSKQLIGTFQALLAQLPDENRDLIRTVSELIRAVAHDSRETKMPLSNLLLVFCPSLNMSPPLLRVLCEAQGIWEAPEPSFEEDDDIIVMDIQRDNEDAESYEDARDGTEEDGESMGRKSEDTQSLVGYNASTEDVYNGLSMSSALRQETHSRKASGATSSLNDCSSFNSTSEDYGNTSRLYSDVHSQSVSPPPLSSSAESLDTPATSSLHDSLPDLPTTTQEAFKVPQLSASPVIADSVSMGLSTSRRPIIGNPVLIDPPIQFPSIKESASAVPAKLGKRRSIPILSLPNLTFKSASSSDSTDSPSSSLANRPKRMKKPSLQLLFQKSSSSLSSPKASPAQSLRPTISSPYLQARSASDSSVSTPLSTVTAPQASTTTLPKFPPRLDTPIEGSALRFGQGLGVPVDETPATPETKPEHHEKPFNHPSVVVSRPLPASPIAGYPTSRASASSASLIVRPGSTPIADRYHRAASPSPSLALRPSTSQLSLVTPLEYTNSAAVSHLRPNPTSRSRGSSTSSNASSNHLGLLDEDVEQEDWTKSVLLAADGGWANQQQNNQR
ncbi:hypothetical protein H0H87_000202 [Tephrocybe sp. NHM501043]|nr:hypothetical protein H0H87_000202 [Tephrocybe sp. NHM501043]